MIAARKTKVGKYTIIKMIAQGGMGKIYRARHPTLNRDIILKRLALAGNKTIARRFLREAELMLDFREDRIVQVYDHFKEGASYYIAMEFVDGISLAEVIEKHRYLPNDIALMIFYEICRALKYAHDKGVVHRDIKPENILISRTGAVKLTDFGIATSKESHGENLTRDMTLGTPAYMSPEQIDNSSTVDHRSDIYSLGVVLYKMVTGKSPYPGNMTPETITRIARGEYRPPHQINPKISSFLRGIIKKAMHRLPEKRYNDLEGPIAKIGRRLGSLRNSENIKSELRAFLYRRRSSKHGRAAQRRTPAQWVADYRKWLIAGLCACAVLVGLAGYAISRGYHNEIINQDEVGALEIELIMPPADAPGIRNPRAELWFRAEQGFQRVQDVALRADPGGGVASSQPVAAGARNDATVFRSDRLYIPSGRYRALLRIHGTLHQHEFLLLPRNLQRRATDHLVSLRHEAPDPAPIQLRYRVTDSNTRRDITDFTKLLVKYGSAWRPLGDVKQSTLASGREYSFVFQQENYFPKLVRTHIHRQQPRVFLDILLQPIPGQLYIRSDTPGIEMRINDEAHYLDGKQSQRVISIEPLDTKGRRLTLAPGTYFLTLSHGAQERFARVNIASKERRRMLVDYDDQKNDLNYTIL